MSDDTVHVAQSVLAALGREWQKADAVELLDTGLGWLMREGANPHAVAAHLRRAADVLDADPTAYLYDRLTQQQRDLEALVAAREAA